MKNTHILKRAVPIKIIFERKLIRAWVSTGAKGAWHLQNFWTVLSGTHGFWQFYYTTLCFTLKIWGFTTDWHPLLQIPNSSPVCKCGCSLLLTINRNRKYAISTTNTMYAASFGEYKSDNWSGKPRIISARLRVDSNPA